MIELLKTEASQNDEWSRLFNRELDSFIAMTKADHLLIYLPFDGTQLKFFLDSCFHRNFMKRIRIHEFQELALFTERSFEGMMFLLVSRIQSEFNMRNVKSVTNAGVFDKAFGRTSSELLPCYAFTSNTLLVEQDNFYIPGGALWPYRHGCGAEWLTTYLAIRDGYFPDDEYKSILNSRSVHECSCNQWCGSERVSTLQDQADWQTAFPSPWETPYHGVKGIYPYRLLNVRSSELGVRASGQNKLRDYIPTSIPATQRAMINTTAKDPCALAENEVTRSRHKTDPIVISKDSTSPIISGLRSMLGFESAREDLPVEVEIFKNNPLVGAITTPVDATNERSVPLFADSTSSSSPIAANLVPQACMRNQTSQDDCNESRLAPTLAEVEIKHEISLSTERLRKLMGSDYGVPLVDRKRTSQLLNDLGLHSGQTPTTEFVEGYEQDLDNGNGSSDNEHVQASSKRRRPPNAARKAKKRERKKEKTKIKRDE
ncbi:hypothetical protein K469DRAFT_691871 [Zopfia rhizophila CBS 207.26]|uniref:Uncharacterized protein n=1 Tax=Zopfia rhizophila CBS 207.26 TaxID=1314779 RepID=A0A6A6DQL0_9PEZI|nr:hypothetical protein K469DRAFT_691871 [Zopfia rhizophila CBS 207.26]